VDSMATKGTEGADPALLESVNGQRSRRGALAVLGAGGAAAIATLLSRDQAHAGHDATNTMHLGVENFAPTGAETEITADVEGFGFRVFNNGATAEVPSGAIGGHSDAGVAASFTTATGDALQCDGRARFFGDVEDNLVTVENENSAGNGFSASAHGQYAVEGVNLATEPGDGSAGVVGVSGEDPYGEGPGNGVLGASGTGVGVAGFCPSTGVGVQGDSVDGVGVRCFSENGTALEVQGKAAFANAGSGSVAAGQSSASVNAVVTAQSHITVTLTSNPGGRSVSWVDRNPGTGFTVHLSKKGPAVDFTYLVVEPG
jgi:hypothetical protein